ADHDRADLSRLPPVSMVTGWWDLFLPGQLRDYQAIRAAGVTARLTVGPWLHGDPGELREITRQDIAWLDHHLRGGPPPAARRRRAHRCGSSSSGRAPGSTSRTGRRRPAPPPATCAPPAAWAQTPSPVMPRPARSSTTPRTRRPRPEGPSCGRRASRSTTP